jgi:hypothetical protein
MKVATLLCSVALVACESTKLIGPTSVTPSSTGWVVQPKLPAPAVFSDSGSSAKKVAISNGYYEQSGTEVSKASWEGVAHYKYLTRRKINLGRIENSDFSISPTGRYAAITTDNGRSLKVYDAKTNRYFLQPLPPSVVAEYHWIEKEPALQLTLTQNMGIVRIAFPKK